MSTRFVAVLGMLLLSMASAFSADDASLGDFRKWTDTSAKFEVDAEFVGVGQDADSKNMAVTLRKRDGTLLTVVLSRLSEDSRKLALQLNSRRRSASSRLGSSGPQTKPGRKDDSGVAAAGSSLPVFDVHFCVITKNPAAHRVATEEQLRKEVEILNTYFVTADRRPIVRFQFKSAQMYEEVAGLNCRFVELGDGAVPYDSDEWARRFNASPHPQVRDLQAINFYVFDSYGNSGAGDQTSHGKRNSNRPYVLIDWQRLNHNTQGVEEHEMGHAFGLEHVQVPGATMRSHTNIMAGAHAGGSGGLRDIGFDAEQTRTILHHAAITYQKLYGKPMPASAVGTAP
jgi:hypothetical protein